MIYLGYWAVLNVVLSLLVLDSVKETDKYAVAWWIGLILGTLIVSAVLTGGIWTLVRFTVWMGG